MYNLKKKRGKWKRANNSAPLGEVPIGLPAAKTKQRDEFVSSFLRAKKIKRTVSRTDHSYFVL